MVKVLAIFHNDMGFVQVRILPDGFLDFVAGARENAGKISNFEFGAREKLKCSFVREELLGDVSKPNLRF